MTPRGIRLNNPGNIRHSKDKWQGLSNIQDDPRFLKFIAPEWGIRAMVKILITYQTKYGCNNIAAIVYRYAPPEENNAEAYIRSLCSGTAIDRGQPLDVRDYQTCLRLVKAIIRHENGVQPYDEATIVRGLELAGVGSA